MTFYDPSNRSAMEFVKEAKDAKTITSTHEIFGGRSCQWRYWSFLSVISMLRGTITSRAVLFIVGISTVGGALISLLFSSETITEKKRDELVRKSDD